MSSQIISETCGITMYKGRGRFPSVLRLRETLVLDKKPPVTLIILIMVDKAFYLVITTFNPAFGKPFGGPERGFDPALWTRNLRLKPVSAHLQLPIYIHTHLKTVLPDSRNNFKGTFPQGEKLGVSLLGSFALAFRDLVVLFCLGWQCSTNLPEISQQVAWPPFPQPESRRKMLMHPYIPVDDRTGGSTSTCFDQKQADWASTRDTTLCCGTGGAGRKRISSQSTSLSLASSFRNILIMVFPAGSASSALCWWRLTSKMMDSKPSTKGFPPLRNICTA